MTADLIPVNRTVDPAAVRDLGALVAASDYFADAKEAAQAAVKIMAGAELGLGPIASMRGIDIIKGEVTLSAGAVAALVRRSGVYDYAIKRWDDSGCAIVFSRNGKILMPVSEFGPADAKRAGLGGQNYQKYPRNMYFARAMTNGARMHCPDLFVGSVYAPDELQATAVEIEPPDVAEAEDDAGVTEAEERPVEAAGDAPKRAPDPVLDPITEGQYGYLKGLLQRAMREGLKGHQLRAALNHVGLEDVELKAGWMRELRSGQASKLIDLFRSGFVPTGESDVPSDDAFYDPDET